VRAKPNFRHGLWVTLPIEQVRERLRPVASEADAATLREEAKPPEDGQLVFASNFAPLLSSYVHNPIRN
jgi:hypothetical protein